MNETFGLGRRRIAARVIICALAAGALLPFQPPAGAQTLCDTVNGIGVVPCENQPPPPSPPPPSPPPSPPPPPPEPEPEPVQEEVVPPPPPPPAPSPSTPARRRSTGSGERASSSSLPTAPEVESIVPAETPGQVDSSLRVADQPPLPAAPGGSQPPAILAITGMVAGAGVLAALGMAGRYLTRTRNQRKLEQRLISAISEVRPY